MNDLKSKKKFLIFIPAFNVEKKIINVLCFYTTYFCKKLRFGIYFDANNDALHTIFTQSRGQMKPRHQAIWIGP